MFVDFSPIGSGVYECDVILRGTDDVRVFHVEVRRHCMSRAVLIFPAGKSWPKLKQTKD